ncbi:MAG TPA: T9SS type A sorting domain-containing protein [Bacteroidia bacterium]|jgi:hypothetical protein|nr:T9SS type A sorting domain-containing protein [Bacteroidia bacterium]
MKKLLLPLLFSALLTPSSRLHAQQKVELQMSPKPAITVNGNNCSILNTIWSCVTRVCDSVVIDAGDSVEFCTSTEIYLNTDTAYWLQYNFYGSSNYPDSVYHHYPYNTPFCIFPKWDVPGDYYVDVYYNGWLSAYPYSDCYGAGPSHWIVHIVVMPNPNGIQSHDVSPVKIFPDPSDGKFNITGMHADDEMIVTDISGRIMLQRKAGNENELDIREYPSGIYFLHLTGEKQELVIRLVKTN